MSLFVRPFLLSLPGSELLGIDLPGSVFELHEILATSIAPPLRLAVELVRDEARRLGSQVICVARPALFTPGMPDHWLRQQVGPATEHLCLSDGTSIQTIASCRNAVFFYRRETSEDLIGLRRMIRRAPESHSRISVQINSCFSIGQGAFRNRPAPNFISRATPPDHPKSSLLTFFFNRDSVEDSVSRIAASGPVVPETVRGVTGTTYLPLTEIALSDQSFARAAAELLLRAFFEPQTLLILRLPSPDLAASVAILGAVLRATGIVIPRTQPRHILLATQDIEETHPLLDHAPLHIIVPESFDFWRHSEAFYARAIRVTVLATADAPPECDTLPMDLSEIYGPRAVRRWLLDPSA